MYGIHAKLPLMRCIHWCSKKKTFLSNSFSSIDGVNNAKQGQQIGSAIFPKGSALYLEDNL